MKGRSACAAPPSPPFPPPLLLLLVLLVWRSPPPVLGAVRSRAAPRRLARRARKAPRRPPPAPRLLRRRRPAPRPPPPPRPAPPAPEPCARRCGHERLELLHRQPDGGQHLPGRGHRGLQGRALRLGRRPGQDLRQHHARGSERAGGEGPQQPLRERADAGRAEVLRHPGQPAHGRGEHHGPADKEHRRGPHLQHHRRHDQQDNRARHGQGGHPRRLHQQEMLRDGQPLATVAVLTRLLVPSVVLLMERCEDVQDSSDRPGRPAWPLRDQPRHTIAAYSNFSCSRPLLPPLLLFFSNVPLCPEPPLLPSISFLPFFSTTNPYCCQIFWLLQGVAFLTKKTILEQEKIKKRFEF